MKCSHCEDGHIVIRPTCEGVELGCPGCGHVYPPEEFRELLSKLRPRTRDRERQKLRAQTDGAE